MFVNFLYKLLRLYWAVFKPKTFGVKILIFKSKDKKRVLLVRHSYGSKLWNIPGGGYNPRRECAESAAKREIYEELGIKLESLSYLGRHYTDAEGKKDTVTIFESKISSNTAIKPNMEILESRFFDCREVLKMKNVAKIAKLAISLSDCEQATNHI